MLKTIINAKNKQINEDQKTKKNNTKNKQINECWELLGGLSLHLNHLIA